MQTVNKFTNWYFTKAALPFWGILMLDCILVVLSGFIAYTLNHGVSEMSDNFVPLSRTLCVDLVCYIISFRLFQTYVGVIRFSSFSDLMRLLWAVLCATALVFVVQWLLGPLGFLLHFRPADVILFGLLSIAFLFSVRIWMKTIYEEYVHRNARDKVFILGVKSGGAAIAKNINTSEDSQYKLVAFVSDLPEMQKRLLMGKRIYLFDDTLPRRMLRAGAKSLIVSPLMMNCLHDNPEITDALVEAGIKILVLPNAREWDGHTDLALSNLKPVDVEDLLPREKIEIDMKAAAEQLTGNTVLITGAAGSIGSEMVRQVAEYRPGNLLLVDQAETPMHDIRLMMKNRWPEIPCETVVADISDPVIMERLFRTHKPDYVFHAAAYKHVPMMEDNPYESVVNNIYGTKVIADLAVKYGVSKFVMVSTDKAVNPTNVMGCSKRICEIYVQSLDKAIKEGKVEGRTQFVTTRFGNVLGSNGSVIPLFQKQIAKGGPLTVTHPNIIRFFMLIPEACKLVIEAGTMGKGGEIYVFDMGEPVRIADLAKRMIKLSGAKGVEIVYTGLRDGEKLYEEVLTDAEVTLPTFHPKIKIAKVREYDFEDVDCSITALVDESGDCDDMEIVARMKRIVPEYKSSHSKYEKLDS